MTVVKSELQIIAGYFGKKEGQDLKGLAAEIKELTAEDKRQLAEGITNGSLTYEIERES